MTARPDPPSPAKSAQMSRVRNRHTAPELAIRRELHRRGLRYRTDMPVLDIGRTRPDIVFTRVQVAVFVDGCFWHRCPDHAPSQGQRRLVAGEAGYKCQTRPRHRRSTGGSWLAGDPHLGARRPRRGGRPDRVDRAKQIPTPTGPFQKEMNRPKGNEPGLFQKSSMPKRWPLEGMSSIVETTFRCSHSAGSSRPTAICRC